VRAERLKENNTYMEWKLPSKLTDKTNNLPKTNILPKSNCGTCIILCQKVVISRNFCFEWRNRVVKLPLSPVTAVTAGASWTTLPCLGILSAVHRIMDSRLHPRTFDAAWIGIEIGSLGQEIGTVLPE
jgi:hypothetical protein